LFLLNRLIVISTKLKAIDQAIAVLIDRVRVLSRKRNNQIRDIIYKYVNSLGIEEIIIGYN
jgi:hypothetical protein